MMDTVCTYVYKKGPLRERDILLYILDSIDFSFMGSRPRECVRYPLGVIKKTQRGEIIEINITLPFSRGTLMGKGTFLYSIKALTCISNGPQTARHCLPSHHLPLKVILQKPFLIIGALVPCLSPCSFMSIPSFYYGPHQQTPELPSVGKRCLNKEGGNRSPLRTVQSSVLICKAKHPPHT